MSDGSAVLWTLLALAVLAVLAFLGIVVKFVANAAVKYSRRKPVQAAAFFAVPGGLATFTATFFHVALVPAMVIGLVAGLAVFLLVAVELG
ncbi:hypothetical protein QEZ54_28920 [Catellatospora sp. KI3]|uniref:hypothetical protein n=1 Tax=Catellatospora sp. KI3 TaxID=3041620 RepID=UPI00248323B1|nr:hypothetical protein [Catellatospora sp. KI3]MDI1464999.1 hypothetical protein [Catellatospora sp. KI3]